MKYVAKPEEVEDLYEIIVKVELDGVKARTEKYPVKRTKQNFLPLQLTPQQEDQGYSHRMSGRVPVDDLLKLQRLSFGDGNDHVWRHIYFLKDQRETALALIRNDIDKYVQRTMENSKKLHDTWFNRPYLMEQKPNGRATKNS